MELKEKEGEKINLKNLSTIQKILQLQSLLKIMTSIKQRFLANKNKMLQKIDENCFKYFKNKIYIKDIFNYCSNKGETPKEYHELKENPQSFFNESYQSMYDFYFLIRYDNSLMLKIIELSDKSTYTELSDFLVNFLYCNIIKSSFSDDELMIMIYLLLENFILKNLPNTYDINNDISSYLNNNDNFLFHVFKSLTRKIDLRNFLCTILNAFILRFESLSISLSTDINIVNRNLKIQNRRMYHGFMKNMGSLQEEKKYRKKKKFQKMHKNDLLIKKNTTGTGNLYLKRTKKITLGTSVVNLENNNNEGKNHFNQQLKTLEESLTQKPELEEKPTLDNKNYKKFEKRKTEFKNNDLNNNLNQKKNESINNNDLSLNKNNSEVNRPKKEEKDINLNITKNKSEYENRNYEDDDLDENGEVKIDIFFELNSITIERLKKYLLKYENNNNKDNSRINSAMKEYLNNLISKINNDKNNSNKLINNKKEFDNAFIKDKEIYSNSLIIEELKSVRTIKQSDSFRGLMRKIRFNHRIITRIIINIINKLKENLISSPYSLKCISKIINILLNKKNELSKNKLSDYQILIFEVNFLIGSIILPILKNPEFNGIVFTNVISEMTRENLKFISDIIETMIKGKLFNKKENPYMTIFNTFIIETLPQFFELVQNIEKNFKLPQNIINLIISYNKKRNINYDYFLENKNENINYQNICFSLHNLYYLLHTILYNKKIFIDENTNKEQKLILKNFLDKKDIYINYYMKGLKSKKFEYFYITKVTYNEIFEKKIEEIIQDNFIYIEPKEKNDIITAFKKCINEVLNYTNIIQIENFYDLSEEKDLKTFKKKKKKSKKEEEKKNSIPFKFKKNLVNSLGNSLIKIALANKEDDADFKNILFPQIEYNINFEINYNIYNDIEQRIIFCTNFLHLYMRKIPENYKKNNYSLLFDELINETQNNIEYLNTNALLEFYKKIKETEKTNMMNSSYTSQIKDLEKINIIGRLYNKLLLKASIKVEKDPNNVISSMKCQKENNKYQYRNDNEINVYDYLGSLQKPITSMIDEFPDFHEYEEEYDNILDIEESAFTHDAIKDYFSVIKQLVKKEKMVIQRYNSEEIKKILYDFENYILTKLYDKLFPFESTKEDVLFYKKCKRLEFIKPENICKDKKIINEKLLEEAIQLFDTLDEKLTPIDKMKIIEKVLNIIQNSVCFSTGKGQVGTDDILDPLLYVVIKSKPENIFSNYKFCELYLNSDLVLGQYGKMMNDFFFIIRKIQELKYTDLIGVSKEKFGKDEIDN